jgi:hypothetical protein
MDAERSSYNVTHAGTPGANVKMIERPSQRLSKAPKPRSNPTTLPRPFIHEHAWNMQMQNSAPSHLTKNQVGVL